MRRRLPRCWYSAVHVKTMESNRLKALLGAREQLVNLKRQLYGQIRGLLRPFGIKISARAGGKRFDEEVRSSCNRHDALYIGLAALLDTLARVEVELAGLDKKVRQITTASKPCWHLMSVPGVGSLDLSGLRGDGGRSWAISNSQIHRFLYRAGAKEVSVRRSGCDRLDLQAGQRDVAALSL